MPRRGRQADKRPRPIIRKEEPSTDSPHGGAWKVAYADFVTAMMAFFLVMWLLNATTEDQRKGLADYFSPSNLLSHASSGTGQPFGGHSAFDSGAMVSDRGTVQVLPGHRTVPPDPGDDPGATAEAGRAAERTNAKETAVRLLAATPGEQARASAAARALPVVKADAGGVRPLPDPKTVAAAAAKAAAEAAEQKRLERAAEEVRRAITGDPSLAAFAKQIAVDVTPDGLRIQLLDQENRAMFATGSAVPNEEARLLITKITPILLKLPGQVSIQGHTDAAPYPGPERTNWDLSAERANAARRMLTEAGLPDARVQDVTGYADHKLLLPAQPLAPANRRIAITVLRTTSPPPSPLKPAD